MLAPPIGGETLSASRAFVTVFAKHQLQKGQVRLLKPVPGHVYKNISALLKNIPAVRENLFRSHPPVGGMNSSGLVLYQTTESIVVFA
jgi:hypothetical protein